MKIPFIEIKNTEGNGEFSFGHIESTVPVQHMIGMLRQQTDVGDTWIGLEFPFLLQAPFGKDM